MGNIQDYIAPQTALKKGYFILIIIKFIKYNKKRNIRPFKAILRVSK